MILGDGAAQWLAADRPDLAVPPSTRPTASRRPTPTGWSCARGPTRRADWPAAQAALERVIAADPDDALAHALLAAALRRQGEPEAALAEARRRLRACCRTCQALFETAAALAETGDTVRASDLAAADPRPPRQRSRRASAGEPAAAPARPGRYPFRRVAHRQVGIGGEPCAAGRRARLAGLPIA